MRYTPARTGKRSPVEPETGSNPEATADTSAGEWLSIHDVSKLFRIALGTLRYWRSAGSGPPYYQLAERTCLYKRSDVEAWLAERVVRPEPRQSAANVGGAVMR